MRGADLFDIDDRVTAIEFGPGGDALFTRVEDPQRIARLVQMISAPPIDLEPALGCRARREDVAIRFEFIDGTRAPRGLDRNQGRFADVLNVGDDFDREVEQILSAPWCTPEMRTRC
jgi:hypothetical protein